MKLRHLAAAVATAIFASLVPGQAHATPGDLYAVNRGDGTIKRFTPGGTASVFASSGLSGPRGLAFDAGGNLYAANSGNNTIERFTPGGAASVFASSGRSFPGFLAFEPVVVPTPVPKPASAALLALSVVGLGLAAQAGGTELETVTRFARLPVAKPLQTRVSTQSPQATTYFFMRGGNG